MTTATTRHDRSAIVSIWMAFFLGSAMSAGWTVRIPAVKAKLGLSDGQLGLEVLGWGLAALVAMQVAGPVIARFGSRRVLQLAVPGVALSLIPVGLAPTFPVLVAAGALYGFLFGLLDVAMNTQAALVQHRVGRRVMGRMHAGWSIGAVVGGLLGALSARLGADFTTTMVIFATVGFLFALAIGRGYLADPRRARNEGATPGAEPRRGRTGLAPVVAFLGVVAFCVFLAEGAVADWSGVYLHDNLGATEAIAALAYPLFESVMALGRLVGDRWSERVSPRALVAGAGCATAAAFVLVVAAPGPVIALIGFAVVGASICLVGPALMSMAGSAGRDVGAAAIARVSTLGYSGLLLGPVAIGLLADFSNLRWGFALAVLACLGWAAVGWRRIGRPTPAAGQGPTLG